MILRCISSNNTNISWWGQFPQSEYERGFERRNFLIIMSLCVGSYLTGTTGRCILNEYGLGNDSLPIAVYLPPGAPLLLFTCRPGAPLLLFTCRPGAPLLLFTCRPGPPYCCLPAARGLPIAVYLPPGAPLLLFTCRPGAPLLLFTCRPGPPYCCLPAARGLPIAVYLPPGASLLLFTCRPGTSLLLFTCRPGTSLLTSDYSSSDDGFLFHATPPRSLPIDK